MASQFTYAGVSTRRPVVLAKVEDVLMIPSGTGSTRVVALLGVSEGGEPGKPEFYGSSQQAAARHRGGDILKSLQYVFSPSPQSAGARLICTIRVNPATKATKTLLDSTTANSIVVSSANWGLRENGLTVKVESGSTSGKKVTISDGKVSPFKDNIYKEAFSIQYVGAGSAATMTIDGDNLATTVTGGPGGENLDVNFNSYTTIQQLVNYIDALAAYTCVIKTTNPDEVTLNGLDFVTAVTILAAPVTVTGTLNEIVRWLNTGTQGLVTATRASGAGLVPTNISTTYLAGGGEGTTTSTEWQAALDALTAVDVTYVVPLTGDAAIHAKALAHVAEQSVNAIRQRRGFFGAAAGEYSLSLSAYQARAAGINSDRAALVPMGIKVKGDDGAEVTLAPYFLAALLAGMQAGLPNIGDSMTHKVVSVPNLEWVPTVAQVELGTGYGLLMVEQIDGRGGFQVNRGISTWLANDAYHRVEISTGEALDEVVRRMVTGLSVFIGQKASNLILYQVASKSEDILRELSRADIIVGDIASLDENKRPFRKLVVTLNADIVTVAFECSPVIPINFIGVEIHARPFAGTFTVSVI